MLSVDRASLHAKAARVEGRLAADDPVWEEADVKPAGPVQVTGRLSAAGEDRYYFSGHMKGVVETDCRRCLGPASAVVEEELHLLFAEAGDEDADEADMYLLDPRARDVDLRPAVREQWLLVAPAFVLCRDDCKGLCPRCGADLNQGSCDCEPDPDPRWSALNALRRDT